MTSAIVGRWIQSIVPVKRSRSVSVTRTHRFEAFTRWSYSKTPCFAHRWIRDEETFSILEAVLTETRPSPRGVESDGLNGQCVGIWCCFRTERTRSYVHSLPVCVCRPSAFKRSAIWWSGITMASSRICCTKLASVIQCQPNGGQATWWLVVVPPLQMILKSALRVSLSLVKITSWVTRRNRRFLSTIVVVRAFHNLGRSIANSRTACQSASARGAKSVRWAMA